MDCSNKKNIIGIIPARYNSQRFKGKPLAEINGKTMIQRVYNQCAKCNDLNYICVATDDKRIFEHVIDFGGNAIMTSANHTNGTERIGEAIETLECKNMFFNYVINIQGDEPFISPNQITEIANILHKNVEIATLIKKIENKEILFNENSVKVVVNKEFQAIYFSRTAIPFQRNCNINDWLLNHTYYLHIGIYGFDINILKEILKLKQSKIEQLESLEQLRWLYNGYKINTAVSEYNSFGIDTPSDLEKAKQMC